MKPLFIPDAIYRSKTHGLCEFKRVDEYMGERTLEFNSLKYGRFYVLPSALNRHFDFDDQPHAQTLPSLAT